MYSRRLAPLFVVAVASPAYAHSPVPGIEGFYIGLLHPFSTPSQALLMIGLGLLAGGFDVGKARFLLGAFLISNLVALIVGLGIENIDASSFTVAFCACALAALFPGKPAYLALALVAIGGFLIGEASIPDDGPMRDRLFTMSGSMAGANIGLIYLFGIIHVARERYTWPWVAIAFRIAAAWLGAIALLMLALGVADIIKPL